MSLVTDSPVHSSSSDDFASYLDAALDSASSDSSPDEKAAEEEDFENLRTKRRKVVTFEESVASTSNGQVDPNTLGSLEKSICTHPGSFGNMCIVCGQSVDGETGVTLGYIHKGLRLNNDEMARLRDSDVNNLLRHKKLYLVLDLDHTLLNSTLLPHLTTEEVYLIPQADPVEDVSKGSLFVLKYMDMMTKLRPFIRTFLKEVSEMFELYIYTMGDRRYAREMARLLDPQNEYFNGKVISRDDGTQRHQKDLDIVLGKESAVVILDDTESAWSKHKENLILMERYHFFASSGRQFGFHCKSMAELKSDENELEGALTQILKVLKLTHQKFFDEHGDDLADRDVRQVLKNIKKEVLTGCKIIFSHIFPTAFQAENHYLWKMAKQMGASCVTELDPSVTHVVANDAGTDKSRWAVKENKFLVHPRWIESANYFWQRQPEESFSVNQTKNL